MKGMIRNYNYKYDVKGMILNYYSVCLSVCLRFEVVLLYGCTLCVGGDASKREVSTQIGS